MTNLPVYSPFYQNENTLRPTGLFLRFRTPPLPPHVKRWRKAAKGGKRRHPESTTMISSRQTRQILPTSLLRTLFVTLCPERVVQAGTRRYKPVIEHNHFSPKPSSNRLPTLLFPLLLLLHGGVSRCSRIQTHHSSSLHDSTTPTLHFQCSFPKTTTPGWTKAVHADFITSLDFYP